MEVKTHLFFSVPVTIVNFGEQAKDLNESLVKDALFEKSKNPTATRSAIKGWQSEGGMENRYESFNQLREHIQKVIESILPGLGFTTNDFERYFNCGDLWVNILNKPGAFHVPHIHGTGETLFAGVYYPKSYSSGEGPQVRASSVPEPGDLMLFDPASTEKRAVIPQSIVNRYPYYGSEICVRPIEGTLVIFPSYLMHMVSPLDAEEERISVSFSYVKRMV